MMRRYFNSFLLMTALCILVTFASPAHAINRYVNVNGCSGMPSPCYTSINNAVDASSGGDVIYIYPGTYTNDPAWLDDMTSEGDITLITVNASGIPTPGTATLTNNTTSPIASDPGFTGNITINGLILECTDPTPVEESESGLYLVNVTGNITLIDVDARSTSWDGVAIYGCHGNVSITRCTAHNSYDDGFSISDSDERDTVGNVTITDSRAYGNYQDGFQIRMEGNITVEDCLSENNDTPDDPDNDEDGFQFEVEGNITVDGCTARNNGQEGIDIEYCAGDAVITNSISQNNGGEGIDTDRLGYSLLIERCRSLSNTGEGIEVAGLGAPEGSITVSCNDIVGNYEGLHLYQAATVDAINNWWGNASGPAASGNPGGTGDSIVIEQGGTVNYNPWLTAVFSRSETCGGSQNIPTLSEWGMIIMAILLAAIAMKFIARRQTV